MEATQHAETKQPKESGLQISKKKKKLKDFSLDLDAYKASVRFTPSVLDNIEKGNSIPPVNAERIKTREMKKKKLETAGAEWYDLPATKMTPEIKTELKLLTMRNFIDPKRHYKKWNAKELPKHFQIGTIVENAADFYNGRLTKKERKEGLVHELLADSAFKKYTKRKFLEIQEKQISGGKDKCCPGHHNPGQSSP